MSVWRVSVGLQWGGAGSPGVNSWHLRINDTGDLGTAMPEAINALRACYQDLADTDWGGGGVGIFPTDLHVNLEEVINVETLEILPVDFTEVYVNNGVLDAPQALQIVAGWRTSIAARRGRGRTFLGPLGAHVMEGDGSPANGALVMIRTTLEQLLAASTALNDWAFGVYGLQNQAPSGTTDYSALPHVLRDFTGVSVKDRYGVLRSRRD